MKSPNEKENINLISNTTSLWSLAEYTFRNSCSVKKHYISKAIRIEEKSERETRKVTNRAESDK